MNKLITLAFALFLVAAVSVQVHAQENSDLAGAYLFRFEWGGIEITLKKDGTFTASSGSCTSVTTQSGPYSVSGDVVKFTTLKLTGRSFSDNKERDLTKRRWRKAFLHTEEPFRPESWELQIVRWDERVYLMDREAFGSFIAAINLGFEPRSVDGYRAHYGVIYLRIGDENKPVTGPPPVPAEFLRDLLPAPVNATVVALRTEGERRIATIDRGSADGLKEKMTLISTGPTWSFNPYWISSLTDNSAEVVVWGDIKVGDQLTTRIADIRFY